VRVCLLVRMTAQRGFFSSKTTVVRISGTLCDFVSCEDESESPELVVMATLRSRVRMLAGLERGPACPGHFHWSRSARPTWPG